MAWEDEAGMLCFILAPTQPTPSLNRNALQLGHARRHWKGRGPGMLMNFCFSYQGDSSLPRACLALTELPGVTFIPVCRKHVFHGWLHCIIITRRSFDQNNVISIVRSISPHTISPSPVHKHCLQAPGPCHPHRAHPSPTQNLMMCDTMSRKRERQEGLAKWMDVPLAITAFLTLCQCLPTTQTHKDAHAKIEIKLPTIQGT